MRSERVQVIAGFTLISIIWGSTWLGIKIGLESIPPFFGVAIRFTVAAIILYIIIRLRGERLQLDRHAVFLYCILALLSFSLPFALVYWGEQYISSGLASILFAVYPFVVAIGSHFFLPAEPLNVFKISGILLGFFGIVVIFLADLHTGDSSTAGMIAILISTVMQATSLVVMKKKGKDVDPIHLTFGGMTVGLIFSYGLAFIFEDVSQVHFDAKGIGTIVYLGTFGSVVTFVVYYWLLKRVEAIFLSLVSLVTPVLAVILGTIWLDETLAPRVFTGSAMVLTGILVANGKDIVVLAQRKGGRILSTIRNRRT